MAAHRRHFLFHSGGDVTWEHTHRKHAFVTWYAVCSLKSRFLGPNFCIFLSTLVKQKHKAHMMPSLVYWWLSSQWQCLAFPLCLSLHLLSTGRSANWLVGRLGVCWMQRKSTLLEAWRACCLCTSVLRLVCPGPGLNANQHIATPSPPLLLPLLWPSISTLLAVIAPALPRSWQALLQCSDSLIFVLSGSSQVQLFWHSSYSVYSSFYGVCRHDAAAATLVIIYCGSGRGLVCMLVRGGVLQRQTVSVHINDRCTFKYL